MATLIPETGFQDITLEQAGAINAAQTGPNELSNWKIYNDDHWQDGDLWTGPQLQGTSDIAKDAKAGIARQFTYWNVSREIVDTRGDAVIGTMPQWGSVPLNPVELPTDTQAPEEGAAPTAEQQALDAQSQRQLELDTLLQRWSDDPKRGVFRDRNGILRVCTIHRLLQRTASLFDASGRANLRPFIPPAKRNLEGLLPEVPFAESLKRVYFELCEPGTACIYTDPSRMETVSVYVYKDDDKTTAEISYLDENGLTILLPLVGDKKAAGAGGGSDAGGSTEQKRVQIPFDLKGALWLFEMCDDPILLDSLLSQQKNINKTLTMGDRNTDMDGFLERVLKNVQVDGEYVPDASQPNGKRFVPKPITFGPSTVNNLIGKKQVVKDPVTEKEVTTFADPDYERSVPTGSAVFDDGADRGRNRMLDAAAQSYVRMEDDANASGKSREVARERFKKSLGTLVLMMNGAGSYVFNTAVSIARATSSEKNAYDDLRVDFQCQVDVGALSSVERAEDREQVKAGLMSRERAMTRGGIDDVDAENDRIDKESETSLTVIAVRATAMQALCLAGANVGGAARVVGFNEDQVGELNASDYVPPTDPEGNPLPPAASTGQVDAADLSAGIQADNTLNGAQITAALEVIDRLTTSVGNKIVPAVAIELLAAVGIPRETATTMVEKSTKVS